MVWEAGGGRCGRGEMWWGGRNKEKEREARVRESQACLLALQKPFNYRLL